MKSATARAAVIGFLLFGPLLPGIAHADDRGETAGLAVPEGLSPCAPDDPVAVLEARVATSIGGQYLTCFKSGKEAQSASIPEYAFAIRIAGDGYTSTSLAQLLATVRAQWKDFQPLSTEFKDNYIARLNALIKGAGETSATFASVKPVLVSIDRLDARSYSVVSVRTYVINDSGGQTTNTKVNADALVLRGHSLVHLTMQRVLADASDVAQIQAEIAAWARAIEGP